MEQYINKSALVAEINELKDEAKIYPSDFACGRLSICKELMNFLDTLEVKEIDLENEVDKWYNNEASKEFENVLYSDIEKFAKHFFELGLNTKEEVEEEPYIMGDIGSYTTTTK